jgi:hypothetical protein
VDLDRIVVLVDAVDGQAQRADQPFAPTVRIDADECGVLVVEFALVRLDELAEGLAKGLQLWLHFIFWIDSAS